MAKSKANKWVSFRSNAIIPADVIGAARDRKLQVGEPVQVRGEYADHVVQDGFAVFCAAPERTTAKRSESGADEQSGGDRADVGASVDGNTAQGTAGLQLTA